MLPLILLTFGVFLTLWIGDFYLTWKTAKRVGSSVELNPIMKSLLKFRGKYLVVFKAVELGLFFYLLYYLTSFSGTVPFYTLLGYILFYGFLVANNNKVCYDVTGEQSSSINYIFVALIFFVTVFIYLNNLLYSNLTTSYYAISGCKSSFNDLYWSCQKQNATGSAQLPGDLGNILSTLNLTIMKPW